GNQLAEVLPGDGADLLAVANVVPRLDVVLRRHESRAWGIETERVGEHATMSTIVAQARRPCNLVPRADERVTSCNPRRAERRRFRCRGPACYWTATRTRRKPRL